ncbi:CLUMA_CG020252, isoform A [Clunio marinus]|uniref:CLUMA_CG020252, isoform A n=1 Tax=Clunio marinus TaxID=568069 RepID=A0A1J1J8P1_9DIPT|nr:CLUMA_CG020252, isoform A [Clunio marinus]
MSHSQHSNNFLVQKTKTITDLVCSDTSHLPYFTYEHSVGTRIVAFPSKDHGQGNNGLSII